MTCRNEAGEAKLLVRAGGNRGEKGWAGGVGSSGRYDLLLRLLPLVCYNHHVWPSQRCGSFSISQESGWAVSQHIMYAASWVTRHDLRANHTLVKKLAKEPLDLNGCTLCLVASGAA